MNLKKKYPEFMKPWKEEKLGMVENAEDICRPEKIERLCLFRGILGNPESPAYQDVELLSEEQLQVTSTGFPLLWEGKLV